MNPLMFDFVQITQTTVVARCESDGVQHVGVIFMMEPGADVAAWDDIPEGSIVSILSLEDAKALSQAVFDRANA